MSATVAKPCNGIALAPIRMSDAATGGQKSFSPRTGSYVPPSMRKTSSFPDTPKTVTSVNSSSHEEFPTLGTTPKPSLTGSASWTQIRTRFHPDTPGAPATPTTPGAPTPAPTSGAPTPTPSTNQFAALDDDATAIRSSPSKAPTNFKQVIEDRIKREEAERLGLYEAEPTDPQLMTHAQLTRNGWAVLTLPPKDNVERQAWVAAFNAREDERETVRKAREEMEELMGASYVPPHAPAWTPEPEDDMEDIAEEDDGCDSIS